MKNRGGERKRKRKKKRQTDQRGIFLTRVIPECKSNDKSRGFWPWLTTRVCASDVLMDHLFPMERAGVAVPAGWPSAAVAPVAVPGSIVELKGHAPNDVPAAASEHGA